MSPQPVPAPPRHDHPRPARPRSPRPARGAASTELVLLAPCLMIMIGLVVAGGRLWFARAAVADTAAAAARAASLARTPAQAQQDANAVARSALDSADLHCRTVVVDVDTSAFHLRVGTPGTVTARVGCQVGFGDVFLPGLPGTIRLEAVGRSALDSYRGRS